MISPKKKAREISVDELLKKLREITHNNLYDLLLFNYFEEDRIIEIVYKEQGGAERSNFYKVKEDKE